MQTVFIWQVARTFLGNRAVIREQEVWKKWFSFLCSWSSRCSELCVRTCSTSLPATNYSALISGLPSAESNFHTAISTIISYIQTCRGNHTQQHKETRANTHARTRTHSHTHCSKLFPVWGPASLYHHASQKRGVNGWCSQNTWKQTNSSAYKRHSVRGGSFTMNWE